jgi:GNAT superfamily N-acetyltransferase
MQGVGGATVTYGVLSSDGDIRVVSDWKPVTVKVANDATMPYVPSLMTAIVLLHAATKTLSDDEREAWYLLAQCMIGLKGERAFVLVTEEDNALVGGCGYAHLKEGVFSLNALCVATNCRRKGMGRKLFDFAFKHLTLPGTRNMMMMVNDTNKGAIAFWERMHGVYQVSDTATAPSNLAPYFLAVSKVSHKGRIFLVNK